MKKLKCTAPVGMSREIIRILLRYCSRFTGKQGKLENIWENEPAEKTFFFNTYVTMSRSKKKLFFY